MNKTTPFEIEFQLRPARRQIPGVDAPLADDGGRRPRITQVLALAIQFAETLRHGDAKDYTDLALLCGLCKERVSQIMRLNYLAPDIQVELLYLPPTTAAQFSLSEVAVRKIANVLSWSDQRELWKDLRSPTP